MPPFEKSRKKRRLAGTLGQANQVTPGGGAPEYRLWELQIADDSFARIQGGYSGGPVIDDQGRVIAVATHREGDKQGYALCISNLWRLRADGGGTIGDLLPGLAPPGTDGRCERIRRALADPDRAAAVQSVRAEIEADLALLAGRADLGPAEQTRLAVLELYVNGTLAAETFLTWTAPASCAGRSGWTPRATSPASGTSSITTSSPATSATGTAPSRHGSGGGGSPTDPLPPSARWPSAISPRTWGSIGRAVT